MRKIIIALVCCMVLLLLGYVGYRGYRVWKENHWMDMARDFAAKSDGRNQMLALQQVLRANYRNVEANRMMAGLTEAARSPNALLWRQNVVQFSPGSTDDRMALAKTALLLGNFAVATNALQAMSAAGKQTATYHNLAGNISVALGQREAAQAHFIEATRLEPWNSIPQLNLAILRLQGTNSLDLAEARIGLQRVSLNATNMNLRCLALRGLLADAMRFNQTNTALTLSADLLKQSNSVFSDRLLRLDVLRDTKQSGFKPALAGVQREAAVDMGKIFELARWQMARTGPVDTLAWLKTLPLQSQTNLSVAVIMAEARALVQDWRGLQTSLQTQNWADLEFMRHAFLTRALRGLELTAAAQAEWRQVLQEAGNQNARLGMVLQSVAQWKWLTEAEEILWLVVRHSPENQPAFQTLATALYQGGRTRSLMDLFVLQAKRKSADLGVKNNLAMTALLLEAQELKPNDLARDVYQKAPTNTAYVSTYAFSLHQKKMDAEALKVMQQLPPKALEDPSVAGYYGLILKATGDKAKARAYLESALKAPMLPEEKKLFEQARAGTAN